MTRHSTQLRKGSLEEGKPVRADVDGKSVVIALVSGKVYAMDSVCSHEGGPLEDGTIEGYCLVCPWHQGIFDIRTAKASPQTDWVTDLHSYSTVVDDKTGQILIDTDPDVRPSHDTKEDGSLQGAARVDETISTGPLKMQVKLLDKESHKGTDIVSFRFSRSDGQDRLNYRAGQYSIVDLGTSEDPKGPTRSFTLASSPTEQDSILITTRIRDTPFKQRLSRLDAGTVVKITAPAGNFTLSEDYSKPVVFLSGGIGVTPFRSMIKYATDKQLPVKITMFDSNRNQTNILYKNEFDSWAKRNRNLKVIYTITAEEAESLSSSATLEWKGEKGWIDKA
ncbi:MAG TPA: Rieske 2Fe-2S domain-containing protein, partial [Nitrososphaera sp.]|nr:Rieske 2Fe-2S domain-containing protein [Nitrososphaera sp.]